MKKQVQLTPFELETWIAALSEFDTKIVNEAVVKIGISDDPFPDLGKLVGRCDQIRRAKSGVVRTDDGKQVGTAMLAKIAKAMGLDYE